MKKLGILFVLLAGIAGLIAGCGGQKAEGISADKVIKVGVTAGPHAEVVDEVVVHEQGLHVAHERVQRDGSYDGDAERRQDLLAGHVRRGCFR